MNVRMGTRSFRLAEAGLIAITLATKVWAQAPRLYWLPICFFLFASFAAAQQTNKFKAADTSSPRDTLRSFIDGCNELHELIEKRGVSTEPG